MQPDWNTILLRQFGAATEMFENALLACPEELWGSPMWGKHSDRPDLSEFWYVAYHMLFWLDLYLFGAVEGFAPPAPFTLDELDPEGIVPSPAYTRETLLGYLAHCREKYRQNIKEMSEANAQRMCRFPWGELPYAELLLDSLRHVQEHAAQLNMFIGQNAGAESRWVARGKSEL